MEYVSEAVILVAAVTNRAVSEEALEEIIRRVAEVAQPERIILFGSAARGEMGPNSDVDLLVVKRGTSTMDGSWGTFTRVCMGWGKPWT